MPIDGGGILPLMVAIVGMATLGQAASNNPQPKPRQRDWYRIACIEDNVSDDVIAEAFSELMGELVSQRVLGLNNFESAVKLKKTVDIEQAQVSLNGNCADMFVSGGIQKMVVVKTDNGRSNGGALAYHYGKAIERLGLSLRDLYGSTSDETHDWQVFMRSTISVVGYTDFVGIEPADDSIITRMETTPPGPGAERSAWVRRLKSLVESLSINSSKCLTSWLPAGAQVAVNGNDLRVVLTSYIDQLEGSRNKAPISIVSLSMPLYIKDYVIAGDHDEETALSADHTDFKTCATAVLLDYVDDMESKYGSFNPYDRIGFATEMFNVLDDHSPDIDNHKFMALFAEASSKIRERARLMNQRDVNIVDISHDIYITTV